MGETLQTDKSCRFYDAKRYRAENHLRVCPIRMGRAAASYLLLVGKVVAGVPGVSTALIERYLFSGQYLFVVEIAPVPGRSIELENAHPVDLCKPEFCSSCHLIGCCG